MKSLVAFVSVKLSSTDTSQSSTLHGVFVSLFLPISASVAIVNGESNTQTALFAILSCLEHTFMILLYLLCLTN